MRVKRGKPSFSPAGCAELAVVRFVESMCVPSPEARFADFSSGEAKQTGRGSVLFPAQFGLLSNGSWQWKGVVLCGSLEFTCVKSQDQVDRFFKKPAPADAGPAPAPAPAPARFS